MSTIENQLVAVFVQEDDQSESIVIGVVIDDNEDTLVVSHYLKKTDQGVVQSREVTINKDYIEDLYILDKKFPEETINVVPKGTQLCLPLIGGDQVSENFSD